jgi:manganese oxidase
MGKNRREFFKRFGSLGAGLWVGQKALKAQENPQSEHMEHTQHTQPARPPKEGSKAHSAISEGPFVPIETPDVPKLPWKMVDGAKEFHLIAEPARVEFVPGRVVDVWGYNGSMPGPTIEVVEGDRVRIIFDNHLPEMTTIHWHGLEIPMDMDGVPGLGQDPVLPGRRYVYEFTLHQHGTFFYHSHFAMQEMMGMLGMFIIQPKEPHQPRVDRDFGLMLQEWAILPNNTVPNTLAMEFNWLTINGKAGPEATPMLARQGERVRIRFVNLGMDHHPMHLHGNTFVVTGSEAGRGPVNSWVTQNTVLVGVAQARDIEFDAQYVGDWMIHCHLPHHMMNQMISMVGPMSHVGQGMHTGMGMEEGMGIVRQGHALGEDLGPSLGRDIGESARRERATTTLVGQSLAAQQGPSGHEENDQQPEGGPVKAGPASGSQGQPQGQGRSGQGHEGHEIQGPEGHQTQGHQAHDTYPKDDPAKKQVPGYPQDMWMPMDEMVTPKPELYGLRPTWSGAFMGMMTMIRVLPPELYDKIMDLKKQEPQDKKAGEKKPMHQLKH